MKPTAAFTAKESFQARHPTSLAIYCSDGRFTNAVEELLRGLGYAQPDTLTIPGGPALLCGWSSTFTDAQVVMASTLFLVEAHAIEHVVLLAHEGCGYYRRHLGGLPAATLVEKQHLDLKAAARDLLEKAPGVKVDAYYARVVQERVAFQKLV